MKIGLKRALHDAAFLIILLCVIVIPLLGYKAGENIKTPPFGYVCEMKSDDDLRLRSELDKAGFIECENEAVLKREIMDAHLDCGIVVCSDLDDRLAEGDTAECIKLITSPETLMSELCRVKAVSALSLIYSPYVTYEALEELFSLEDVKEAYYNMTDAGSSFSFDIERTDGTEFIDHSRSINLFKGSLAILVFITAFISICRPVKKHYDNMRKRLGGSKAFTAVLLPEYLVRCVLLGSAVFISCIVCGMPFAGPLLYAAMCCLTGLLLSLILPETYIIVLTVFICILSLGLCPVFTDLALFYPVIGKLRMLLLPYLIWIL